MPLFKFGPNDIFYNQVETHPQCEFFIYDRTIYYNNRTHRHGVMEFDDVTGLPTHFVKHTCPGYVSLYELNIDRKEQAHDVIPGKVENATMIYPFITKSGALTSFKTVSTVDFQNFAYGDIMTGSYPLASTISIERYVDEDDAFWDVCGKERPHVRALKNTLNYHKKTSPHYSYESEEYGNKEEQELTLISIPSILHGSGIERGTVDMRFYLTGSLVGQLQDINENGELIQTAPENSPGYGQVAGVVLYDEGFLILTGSWSLEDTHTERYRYCPEPINTPAQLDNPRWLYWGTQGYNEPDTCGESADPVWLDPTTAVLSSSFYMSFNGTTVIPTVTMLAHAKKGELNHSNNPTYLTHGHQQKHCSCVQIFLHLFVRLQGNKLRLLKVHLLYS